MKATVESQPRVGLHRRRFSRLLSANESQRSATPGNERTGVREIAGELWTILRVVVCCTRMDQEWTTNGRIGRIPDRFQMTRPRMVTKSSSRCQVSPKRPRRRSERTGVLRAELPAPLPDRLVGDEDSTLGEKILDIPEAQDRIGSRARRHELMISGGKR